MVTRREEVRVTADVSNFVTRMGVASAAAGAFAKKLDEADSNMGGLVASGLALAPALVPLGAAAVPALAGLANQLGVAALAAGTAVLAFKGVGDAVSALDTFKAAPTTANFKKLQEAFDKLGPAGQEFALFVDRVTPKLRSVQKYAEAGLLPGVETGIRDLLPLLPQVQSLVFGISSAMGDLVEKGAEHLKTDQWQQFFSFLQADASTTTHALGTIIGNLAQGFASLWQAFDPLSQSFTSGFVAMSRSFNDWAQGLSKTQGFQDFLAYVAQSGPKALDALSAIGNALVQLVEAAAPVGTAVLPIITALANGLSALADSTIGPVLISTAAAVGILGRSLKLLQGVGLKGKGFLNENYVAPSKGIVTAFRNVASATDALRIAEEKRIAEAGRARDAQFSLIPSADKRKAVDRYMQSLRGVKDAEDAVKRAEQERGSAFERAAGSFGKAAIAVGGLALATSGVADKMGLSNTASLAMLGTIAGPWGTAIGGGIGLALDFAQANNSVEDAVKAADAALQGSSVDFSAMTAAVDAAKAKHADFTGSVASGNQELQKNFDVMNPKESFGQQLLHTFIGTPTDFSKIGDVWKSLTDRVHHTADETKTSVNSQAADLARLKTSTTQVYKALADPAARKAFHGTDAELTAFAEHITPALNNAGINVKKFLRSASGSNLRMDGLKAIRDYFANFGSATKPTKAVADAMSGLSNKILDTATAADVLKGALDNLFGVALNQSAADDAWTQSLKDLRHQIKGTNGEILGNSNAAHANRIAIRGSETALLAKVDADARAHVSGAKLIDTLTKGREAMIRQGVAAGATRGDMLKYLATLKLTPKTLTTFIKQDGALSAKQKLEALTKLYHLTPHKVHTIVSEAGADPSAKKIRELARQYHLTPKKVQTILDAVDKASKKTKDAHKVADDFGKAHETAILDAHDQATAKTRAAHHEADAFGRMTPTAVLRALDAASAAIQHVIGELHAVDGQSATVYLHHVTTQQLIINPTLGKPRVPKAAGGFITGPGTATSDDIPAFLSNGEYVMRAAAVEKYGVNMFHRLNAMSFANGGAVSGTTAFDDSEHRLARELRLLRGEIRQSRDEQKKRNQDRRDYAGTVRDALVSDPFSGTLGGFQNQIQFESSHLRTARADLSTLRRRGLSGALLKDLQASGNTSLIHQFAGLSREQLAAQEAAYNRRNQLDRTVGAQAAAAVYPAAALQHQIHALTAEIAALRHGKAMATNVTNVHRATIRDSETKTRTKAAAAKTRRGRA